MDANVKSALIAAGSAIACATISALVVLSSSRANLAEATRKASTASVEAKAATQEARSTISGLDNLMRYVYDNGQTSSGSFAGAKMIVVVNGSRDGGPVSQAVDMTRFTDLCADIDGCLLSLGATRFHIQVDGVADPKYVIEAPLIAQPCRFFYDKKSKSWSLSQSCVAIYGLYAYKDGKYEYSQPYQPYEYSDSFGRDDDGQASIVMGFKGACYLAESAADVRSGQGKFLADIEDEPSTGRGLYLIASSPTWDYPGAYPHDAKGGNGTWPAGDPARKCVLIVED